MSGQKQMKVIISPEALMQMEQDIPHEELQSLLDEFSRLVQTGEIFENSEPVDLDDLMRTDPEVYASLMASLEESEDREPVNPITLN